MTGQLEWEVIEEENYDYHQELARAGFADMLHDYERNRKYYEALKKVISRMKSEGRRVHVLDIGTGTGLLAMIAARCGADEVSACEAFQPMIEVARKCMAANDMSSRIRLIEKRSTEIVVGVDMPERANVLVTEVFDTELIGEGALATFSHALKHLLTPDCYVVPDNATMFVQCIESEQCFKWNWLQLSQLGLKVPDGYQNLAGDSILDVQLTQFREFKPLTQSVEAFKFSFTDLKSLKFDDDCVLDAVSMDHGKAHAIFFWWQLGMDYENEIVLSCAPKWAHPTPNNMQWRDHWMQAIYFPSRVVELTKGQGFQIECNHDEYSLWFDIKSSEMSKLPTKERSFGVTLTSRNRLSQLNDTERNKMFIKLMKKYEDPNKCLLIVNDDFSILPLLAASQTNFDKIITLETNRCRQDYLKAYLKENHLGDRLRIINKSLHDLENDDLKDVKVDIILSELSFNQALLPWDNLYFYYGLEHVASLIQPLHRDAITVLPRRLRFYAIAVSLENLDKIRSPVQSTEGFDIREFDKVILASKMTDGFMEPHPLWEYPSYPLSGAYEIFAIDFTSHKQQQLKEEVFEREIRIDLKNEEKRRVLNGVALWHTIEFDEHDGEATICTGLVEAPETDKHLKWTRDYKQAVHLLDRKIIDRDKISLTCCVRFEPKLGKFNVDFKID